MYFVYAVYGKVVTDLSFNITYYNEPHFLQWWYSTFKRLHENGLAINLNIVDDGSQNRPAIDFFEKYQPPDTFRLFRVKEDIGFNSHGCRNLLMQQTTTDWNVLCDIDLTVADDVIEDIVSFDKHMGKYYMLWDTAMKEMCLNQFCVHKEDFRKSGGYDEEFVNKHYGDRLFFSGSLGRICNRVSMDGWWCHIERRKRNKVYADVKRLQYPDDFTMVVPINFDWADPEYRKNLIEFVTERNKDPVKRMNKPTINFEWEQVF